MHVFKAEGIVLQVGKVSQQELWYTIFFREYGILRVQKQKKVREKQIDIGYHINCEIITHQERKFSTIGNIKVLNFFNTSQKSYSEIELFLKLIGTSQKNIPLGIPHYEIYDILKETCKNISYEALLLSSLKVLSCIGVLPETHSNTDIGKILKFIHNSSIKDILRLKNIPENTQKTLEYLL